jgi:GNAT superfamily N-acetyltransferase
MMPDNVTIRDFVCGDRETYVRLSELFFSSDAVLHRISEENFVRTFEQCMLGSPYLRGLMLEVGGAAAGYALLSFTWSNEAGGMCVLIEEIFVKPDFRGGGIGTAFMSFVEREYGSKARRFRLEVAPSNARAVTLYEKIGYKKLGYAQMVKNL